MKLITLKGRTVQLEYGQFPILVSSDRKEDGKLMSNKAQCHKNVHNSERFYLQPGEKKVLKNVMKKKLFKNITIAKGDAQSSFQMLNDVIEAKIITV